MANCSICEMRGKCSTQMSDGGAVHKTHTVTDYRNNAKIPPFSANHILRNIIYSK